MFDGKQKTLLSAQRSTSTGSNLSESTYFGHLDSPFLTCVQYIEDCAVHCGVFRSFRVYFQGDIASVHEGISSVHKGISSVHREYIISALGVYHQALGVILCIVRNIISANMIACDIPSEGMQRI